MKIIFAYDASQPAQQAGQFLLHRLEPTTQPIEIVSVVDATMSTSPQRLSDLEARADESLQNIREQFTAADWTVATKRLEGEAGRHLLEHSGSRSTDLVVVGDRGNTRTPSTVLGNVSSQLVQHANCSVLVVRTPATDNTDQILRILLAYDGSRPADHAVRWIENGDWRVPLELLLVHVLEPNRNHLEKMKHADAANEALYRLKRQLEHKLGSKLLTVETEVFDAASVRTSLLHAAEIWHADLIVVGHQGHFKLVEHLIGSTAYHIADNARCSVLVVR